MLNVSNIPKLIVAILLTAQLLFAVILKAIDYPNREIFPFFSWNLFSKIPNPSKTYTIRVTEIGGKKLGEPVLYSEIHNKTFDKRLVQFNSVVQKYGESIKSDNQDLTQDYQDLIESNYLKNSILGYVTKYQLISLEFSTLEKYKENQEKIKVVKEFSITQ